MSKIMRVEFGNNKNRECKNNGNPETERNRNTEIEILDSSWLQEVDREFYLHHGNWVAEHLLGKLLIHGTEEGLTGGIIVETEAYCGAIDKGSHAYQNKKTERTAVQFGPGGYVYVYFIYGMYYCFNVVAGDVEVPDAVLIRALEPVKGLSIMENRRWKKADDSQRENAKDWQREKIHEAKNRPDKSDKPLKSVKDLCNGPGKLCQAMAITKEHNALDLCGHRLQITSGREIQPEDIMVSPRINIDYAEECIDYPWRYFVKDNKFVSKVAPRYRKMQRLLYR